MNDEGKVNIKKRDMVGEGMRRGGRGTHGKGKKGGLGESGRRAGG